MSEESGKTVVTGSCGESREHMIDAALGELSPAGMTHGEAHIAQCATCRAERASILAALAASRAVDIRPSGDFAARAAAAARAADATLPAEHRELLVDYTLDELGEDDRLILDNTTLRTAAGRAAGDDLRAVLSATRSLPAVTPSAGFAARVMAAAEAADIAGNCGTVRGLLVDYIFNEVSESQDLAIKNHLRDCADCREENDSLMVTVESARLTGKIKPSSEFVRHLSQRILGYLEKEREIEALLANRNAAEKVYDFFAYHGRRLPIVAASLALHAAAVLFLMQPARQASYHVLTDAMPSQASSRAFGLGMSVAPDDDLPVPLEADVNPLDAFSEPGDDMAVMTEEGDAFGGAAMTADDLASGMWPLPPVSDELPRGLLMNRDPRLSAGVPTGMADRMDALARHRALASYSSNETDTMLRDALGFLVDVQEADGGWPIGGAFGGREFHRAGASALAVLALTGRGFAHDNPGRFGAAVDRGVNYLLSRQSAAGFFGEADNPENYMYAHAIATLALAEDLALTGDAARLREPLERAVAATLRVQMKNGSWMYADNDLLAQPGGGDSSVTFWQLQALRAALDLELRVDTGELRAATKHALRYLDTLRSAEGWMGYDQPGAYPYGRVALTAADLFLRHRLQGVFKRADQVSLDMTLDPGQIAFLLQHAPRNIGAGTVATDAAAEQSVNYYAWYYASHALFQAAGDPFREWNAVMKPALQTMQVKGGDWEGSFSPDGDLFGAEAGRVYTTAMAALTLEVYYRYHP